MNIVKLNEVTNKVKFNITQFTKDQLNAYTNLIEFINNPYNEKDYKRALVGPAGTGKTYLLKALLQNSNLSYSVIGISAPTHKACRVLKESISLPNINVNTLQSNLGLRLNLDVENFDINNPPFDPKGRIKIGEFRIFIIDEASMIPRGLIIFLEKICKTNKCKIIYVGDNAQLPPVNESYSSAFDKVKTFKLTQIVRQEEDNPIRPLLELLRFDIEHKSFNFITYIQKHREFFDNSNIKGYKVCTPKEFVQYVYNNFNDEQLTKNVNFVKVVGYTNSNVSGWNKYIRNLIIKDADTSILTKNDLITSYTTIVNKFNESVIINSEEYILQDIVNYIHPMYEIKGFMVRFVAIYGGKVTTPLFIVDHKDNFAIKRYIQISKNLIDTALNAPARIKAQKWKEYYNFKDSCLLLADIYKPNGKDILYHRNLDYGFALTSHKSQGSTFDTVLVDVNDIVYDINGNIYRNVEEINRRLYVACSRCKNKLYLCYGN